MGLPFGGLNDSVERNRFGVKHPELKIFDDPFPAIANRTENAYHLRNSGTPHPSTLGTDNWKRPPVALFRICAASRRIDASTPPGNTDATTSPTPPIPYRSSPRAAVGRFLTFTQDLQHPESSLPPVQVRSNSWECAKSSKHFSKKRHFRVRFSNDSLIFSTFVWL